MKVCNTEARKRSFSDFITNIIQSGGAPARDFDSLRGRLNFAEGQIFGRGANLRMRALAKACKRAGFVKVGGDLLEALFTCEIVLYLMSRVTLLSACAFTCIQKASSTRWRCARPSKTFADFALLYVRQTLCSFVTMKLLWQP